MCKGRHVDNSEIICFLNLVPEEEGEVEVTEMIHCPLHFQSFRSQFSLRKSHDACIVDEKVDFFKVNTFGEFLDRLSAGQIEGNEINFALRVL